MTVSHAEPSAAAWLERLEARELSARELTERTLHRIEEAGTRLGALAAMDAEAALRDADAADVARRAGDRRPLLGLPVTVKDSLEVAGLVSTGGSLARAAHVPERDATVVARLRAAGAIVAAKTNAPEYSSSYETSNVVYGRTRNPHDPDRTPGGSSGGEAALAAADASPLGIGTDGGGSIRVPAHYCGVVGLRPTVGRVPETGNWPATRASGYMDLYCVGPIARYVDDLALALPLIAGPDGVDPYAVPAPLGEPDEVAVAGLRVGWFASSPRARVTPGTEAAVAAAVAALSDAGASAEPLEPPWEPNPTDLFLATISADGGAQMRADVADAGGRHDPEFAALLTSMEALALSAAEWFELKREIVALRRSLRSLFERVDVIVCPVAAGPAPLHGEPPAGLHGDGGLSPAFDFVHLIAIAGVPAASVPAAAEDGLPVGVQVAAAPYREDVALAAARALESALGGFRGAP
jgi:amidase